ncbi:hypothetical protein L7F22_016420 [Adiantum nelumboides]|nr:hypothetical protein [Adiantum nelumboides]
MQKQQHVERKKKADKGAEDQSPCLARIADRSRSVFSVRTVESLEDDALLLHFYQPLPDSGDERIRSFMLHICGTSRAKMPNRVFDQERDRKTAKSTGLAQEREREVECAHEAFVHMANMVGSSPSCAHAGGVKANVQADKFAAMRRPQTSTVATST